MPKHDVDVSASARPERGRRVQAAGFATNYLEAGQGRPVVLVHGSGPGVSAYANWRLTLGALAPHFRVFAPDLVGFGLTERPVDVEYDLAVWVAHLRGFLDAMGLERPSLVGHSWGGALALALAAEQPDRVDRLVLSGSIGLSFPATEGLEAVWGFEPSLENLRRVSEMMVHDPSLVTEEVVAERHRAGVVGGGYEGYERMFPAPRQRSLDALAMSEERIATLPHETLIIHGREDKIVPVDVAVRFLRLIARSELHVFGRCGHLPQIERADAFGVLVAQFLAR